MRGFSTRIARAFAALLVFIAVPAAAEDEPGWSIAIHGGAGTIARDDMTPQQDAAYRAALQSALDAGAQVLREGGSAMDAIQAAIEPMEDDPLFNAGRGAGIRHPIALARKVMSDSPHVMLAGAGAAQFAAEQGLATMPPEWFETERRKKALERMKAERLSAIDVDIKFGTVGAVALDRDGNMAAGTSTGGMTGKRWGRIGDAPIIGAGTYADNRACAVSATGWGEFFIRVGVAHEICTRLRHRYRTEIDAAQASVPLDDEGLPTYMVHASEFGLDAAQAQEEIDAVIADVGSLGGDGGVIVVTRDGHPLFSMNTSGMYRGRATSDGLREVAIYGDE